MLILGIDPGSSITAFGIINPKTKESSYGYLKLSSKINMEDKLYKVFLFVKDIIKDNNIDSVAVEGSFYSVNIQSATILSQIRAAVIIAAKDSNIDVYQYQPKEVKQAVCGYGGAKKEQIKFIVEKTLNISLEKEPLDVSDALAIALTHIYTMNF